MTATPELGERRKINWLHVNTVLSAAVLIGAEVFGAAYAGGWAVEMLFGAGSFIIRTVHWLVSFVGLEFEVSARAGVLLLQAIFFVLGTYVMLAFIRNARKVEPFTTRE